MDKKNHCPACDCNAFEALHKLVIENNFIDPEDVLHSTNNYKRNYILFNDILDKQVNRFLGRPYL